MSDDEQQPPEAPQGARISRDTLLLLGALTFLIVAVALTFLFTPGATPPAEEPTAVALASVTPTDAPYPVASEPTSPPYPGPGGLPTSEPPALLPTGDASLEASPTADPAGGLQPTADPDAYPGPVGEGTPPALPTFSPPTAVPPPTFPPPPTAVPAPTFPPAATAVPAPTFPPAETSLPDDRETADVPPDEPTPTATLGPPPPPPADVLRGNVRWGITQSPIILVRDVQIAPGAELLIEPGVEVQLDPGVSIFVDGGRLLALGLPDRPVRFVGTSGERWSGIFGRPNSFIVLEHSEVRGGGIGGTVMAVDRSELVVRNSRFSDNGGAILLTDTRLEMRDSEVSGNDMPFGPALEASYGRGSFVTMSGNRFGGNRLAVGAPQVRISNSSSFETLNLTVEGNLIRGGTPNLQFTTDGPLQGDVRCNSLIGDAQGFGLRTRTPQVAPNGQRPMALRVENNYIDEHVPPIIPVYLEFGLGRGATSEILLDMRNNWWGDSSGPYDPEANQLGRGDSVGVMISYAPWLTAPPPCAPPR